MDLMHPKVRINILKQPLMRSFPETMIEVIAFLNDAD